MKPSRTALSLKVQPCKEDFPDSRWNLMEERNSCRIHDPSCGRRGGGIGLESWFAFDCLEIFGVVLTLLSSSSHFNCKMKLLPPFRAVKIKWGSRPHQNVVLLFSLSGVGFFASPGMVAHQAPLSMEFFKQEYWNGLPFPPPGGLPHPGIKPVSPALQVDSLPLSHQGSPPTRSNCWQMFVSKDFPVLLRLPGF